MNYIKDLSSIFSIPKKKRGKGGREGEKQGRDREVKIINHNSQEGVSRRIKRDLRKRTENNEKI